MTVKPPSSRRESPDSLSLKLGNWFEAHATGRGVIAIPVVVLVIAVVAAGKLLGGS